VETRASTPPCDAVITWVDGDDEAHRQKLSLYLANAGNKTNSEAYEPTRFNQVGELKYCVHSILRFAPWIRHIYIVTDAQVPPIMRELVNTPYEDKVKLIDHSEIFEGFEQYLPTFNSRTIESVIWRIKGLSNHYLSLNDDFFLVAPVVYEDFFRDGKVVLRGKWEKQISGKWLNFFRGIKPSSHIQLQENSARLVGWHNKFFNLRHAPRPVNKTNLEKFFQDNPKLFEKNLRYKIRNDKQFWTAALAQYLDIKTNNKIYDNVIRDETLKPVLFKDNDLKNTLNTMSLRKNLKFVCFQSLDLASRTQQEMVFEWLSNKIFDHSDYGLET
jgi:hypothetical protein